MASFTMSLIVLISLLIIMSTGHAMRSGEPTFQEGRHSFTWLSGDVYDGEWKEGKKHGRGTILWSDGDR